MSPHLGDVALFARHAEQARRVHCSSVGEVVKNVGEEDWHAVRVAETWRGGELGNVCREDFAVT